MRNTNTYAHRFAKRYAYCNCDGNAQCDANRYCNCDGNAQCDPNRYCNCDGNA